ncbi:proteinaceous RNase P 1, chloroplastic/mitochondrial-like [Silene latifolia]|uniref:proteinaceous RNase P 1, chloroplastic/mitochondrial-like n=1 Tax=Silene latifolia TaxID=37657 RepID=UPI003D7788E3
MTTFLTFNTLQWREFSSLPSCKCFTSPLHNSLFSHQFFAFPSAKHSFNSTLSSFLTVKNHASKNLSVAFSTLNHNSSLETLNSRNGEGNLVNFDFKGEKISEEGVNVRKSRKRFNLGDGNGKGSGNSSLETVNLRNDSKISSGYASERVNKGGEEYRKRRRSGEKRFNLGGEGNEKGSDKRVGFDSGRKWENNNGSSGWGREYGFENYGNVWKRSEMGSDGSSLSDERERERDYGGGGWSKEYGSENYKETWKRGEMGDGVSRLELGGGKGVRSMERISGGAVRDNGSRGQKGNGVSLRRSKDDKKVHGQIIKDNDDGSKVKRKERLSKKNKADSVEFQLKIGLDMCSKMGDVMGAISLYDSAVKKGIKMGQHQYTVLLYLCSSAAMGVIRRAKSGSKSRSLDRSGSNDFDGPSDSEEEDEDTDDLDDEGLGVKDQNEKLDMNEIKVSDDVKKYALERGFEVYEKMCFDEVQMNEAALTSVARMAMAMGNGDMAFDMVKQMKSMGISPKLRSYGPALSVFSSDGEVEKAFAVENHMLENGVHPEEPELEALLKVSIQSGKADRVYYVLHKLRTNVRSVSPSTAELIEKWFRSREASRVGKRKWDKTMLAQTMENVGGGWHGQGWLGSGKWTVSRTSIAGDGLCRCCGEKLALIDLDPEETERFAESVASIAIKRDRNSSFQMFQRWLDYYGPFEAVVDAANVGLLSQRKFKPSKVNAVVNGIRQLLPSKKWPLIILHNKRVTGSTVGEPMNKAVVEKWRNADALYATPTGSNDDWYWLYAAIKFKCLLVTNDEMRDHTFQLLGNDFFPKWKERHQVRFSFSEIGPVFHMPPPCSVVIQESDRGFWHIPIASEHQSEADRIWLCISRPKLLVKEQDPIVGADPGESNPRT